MGEDCATESVLCHARRIDFQSVEELLEHDQTFDLVNATLLFQRMTPRHGHRILEYLMSRVAPGGYLHIQVPYRTRRKHLSSALMVARYHSQSVNRVANILRRRPADVDALPLNIAEIAWFAQRGSQTVRLHLEIAPA